MHAQRFQFSDEPFIRFIYRHLASLIVFSYTIGVLYVSFIPFDFTRTPHWSEKGTYLGFLRFDVLSITDVLANIGIYVPFGALTFWAMRRMGSWRILAFLVALFSSYLLSFGIENVQHWVISRVSAWADVVANTLGGLIGATIYMVMEPVLRVAKKRFYRSAHHNWDMLLAKLAVCAVLIISVRPYDVVIDVRSAAMDLTRANYLPDAQWNHLPQKCAAEIEQDRRQGMFELRRMRIEYVIDRVVDVGVYAGLTILLCAGMLTAGFRGYGTIAGYTGFIVQTLAVLIIFIRAFLSTWGLDTAHFVCAVVGWGAGLVIVYSLRRIGSFRHVRHEHPDRWIHSRALALPTIAFVLLAVLAYETAPFEILTKPTYTKIQAVNLLPFAPHFKNKPNAAAFDISGELLRFGTLAFCLGWLIFRRYGVRSWRMQLVSVIAITTLAAGASELIHLFIRSRMADTTTVVLAVIASFCGAIGLRMLIDFRGYLRAQYADDLLTSQLIEGESYDRDSLNKLAKQRGDASRKQPSQ